MQREFEPFEDFQETGRDVDDIGTALGHDGSEVIPGRVYLDCLYIEKQPDGDWWTTTHGCDEFTAKPEELEKLERILFHFAIESGYYDGSSSDDLADMFDSWCIQQGLPMVPGFRPHWTSPEFQAHLTDDEQRQWLEDWAKAVKCAEDSEDWQRQDAARGGGDSLPVVPVPVRHVSVDYRLQEVTRALATLRDAANNYLQHGKDRQREALETATLGANAALEL